MMMFQSWTEFKATVAARGLLVQMDEQTLVYKLCAYDGPQDFHCSIVKANLLTDPVEVPSADQLDFEATMKPTVNQKIGLVISKLPESQPFAEPTYRTKHAKKADKVTIAQGVVSDIDYQMTSERWASGGTIVVKNPQYGDFITASIVDTDGTIPEPYRAATCEAWPIVATYIEGQYLELYDSSSIYFKQGIDTRPLVAKISPGLYLRVTYHAVGGDQNSSSREVLVNYFLAKKL